MLQLLALFAEGDAAPQRNPLENIIVLMPAFALLFWLIVWRPAMKRRQQEDDDKLNSLQKDDEVLTIGGIYGTVVSVSQDKAKDEIVVKISDNTRVKMTRSSIHRNMTHEERQKAKSEKKDPPPSDAQAAGHTRKA